jgi:hypothetical protein
MQSLIQRILVSTAIAIVALGSAGNAMAANPHVRARAPAAQAPYRYQAPLDVAAIPPYPNYSPEAATPPYSRAGYDIAARPPYPQWAGGYPVAGSGIDVGRLIGVLLGGALPLHHGGKVAVSGSGSYDWSTSPTYDTSPPADVDAAAEQSAIDATDAAIQQNDANLDALDASIAAAEQQNDAANAETQQYVINNGM